MFHSLFCAQSKYPQEAKLISETNKKRADHNCVDTTPKNGTGGQTGIYFAVIYKIYFDQVFKHFVIL